MKKSSTNNELSKLVKNICTAFCLLIIGSASFWVLSDLRYFSFDNTNFSHWQIPLSIIIILFCLSLFFYFLSKDKIISLIILTSVFALGIIFIPYEKYGDFKYLRDISFCEQDGRLCRENLYPYLTKEWCLANGYKFHENTRFCKMRKN